MICRFNSRVGGLPKWQLAGNANSKPKVETKARADSKMHKLPRFYLNQNYANTKPSRFSFGPDQSSNPTLYNNQHY